MDSLGPDQGIHQHIHHDGLQQGLVALDIDDKILIVELQQAAGLRQPIGAAGMVASGSGAPRRQRRAPLPGCAHRRWPPAGAATREDRSARSYNTAESWASRLDPLTAFLENGWMHTGPE